MENSYPEISGLTDANMLLFWGSKQKILQSGRKMSRNFGIKMPKDSLQKIIFV